MAIEIERKFLVLDDSWREHADRGRFLSQGYLSTDPKRCVRVRVAGDQAWLNIKSAESWIRRLEYDYPIPPADARELLQKACTGWPVEKVRYHVSCGAQLWEVDVFEGVNAGLVVAEIELADEQEPFARPHWLGREVSDNPRYYNMNLSSVPFSQW